MAVNPAVRNYKRIPYIIDYQKMLVKEYKNAYNRFRNDPHFTPQEMNTWLMFTTTCSPPVSGTSMTWS